MELEPNDLLLFARIAESGSFSGAATRLRLPKSTVSRRLAALESHLGERLLVRTTRKLALTDFGQALLAPARAVVDEIEAAQSLVQHRQAKPSGTLRVSMPSDVASVMLADMLGRFVTAYPAITLELDLSPRRVDLVGENFDCALRMGALSDDSTLTARRVARFSSGLYAAPTYLKQHGRPATPADLMQHQTLRLSRRSGEPEQWILTRGEQRWEGTPPTRAIINSPEVLLKMARSGSGIVAVSDQYAAPYAERGELESVLPEWSLPGTDAWAVFPGRRLMPARTRVFLDAVQQEFDSERCRQTDSRVASIREAFAPEVAPGSRLITTTARVRAGASRKGKA